MTGSAIRRSAPDISSLTGAPALSVAAAQAGITRPAAFSKFERTLPLDSCVSFAEWGARRTADGLSDEPASEWFVDRLTSFLGSDRLRQYEIEGLTDLTQKQALRLFHQAKAVQESSRVASRPLGRGVAGLRLADVRDALVPKALRSMPDTCFDPDYGDAFPQPDGPVLARLLGMRSAWMRRVAPVALAIHQSYYPYSVAAAFLKKLERYEDLLEETGADPACAHSVARVIDDYALHRTVFPTDTPTAREETASAPFVVADLLERYASLHPDQAEAVLALRPELPAEGSAYVKSRADLRARLAKSSERSRKRYSDQLADNLDATVAMCRSRRNQARNMELACVRAERHMRERDSVTGMYDHGASLDFGFRERVVRPNGRRLLSRQLVRMRAHRASSLAVGWSDEVIVFEYLGVEAEERGGRCYPAWFIGLFESGALLKPRRLPVSMRDHRREVVKELDLPDLMEKPGGLAGFDGLRDTNLGARMLVERGMVLVPIREWSLAMTSTYFTLLVMVGSLGRIGEILQMTYHFDDPDSWITLSLGGKPCLAFKAIPKCADDLSEYLVSDRAAKLLMTLAKMTKAQEKDGALLPCEGSKDLSSFKKDGARKYVFAFRGRPLCTGDINYCFRLLTAGFPRLRSHDIRHASANRAKQEGHEDRTIKEMMRLRGAGFETMKRYVRPTDAQRRAAVAAFISCREAADLLGLCEATDDEDDAWDQCP